MRRSKRSFTGAAASTTIGPASQSAATALTAVGPRPASASLAEHMARAAEVQSCVPRTRPRASFWQL